MASGEKTIYVYDSFSKAEPVLLGTLYVNAAHGGESYAFSYDPTVCRISIPLAVSVAIHFGITEDKAKAMAAEILSVVRDNWERLAGQYGLSRSRIEAMRPAFDACYY